MVTLPSADVSSSFEHAVNVKLAATAKAAMPAVINRLHHFIENLLTVSRNNIVD